MKGSPGSSHSGSAYPRELAVRALTRVLSDHEPLDEALVALGAGSGELRGDARAWLQEVCSGTLRWKGRLDQAIDAGALKKKPSGWLRKMLLVASYQLIGQERTSPAAVVDETVGAIKRKEGPGPANFANAVLRKIAEQGASWRTLEFPAGADPARAAEWASLPPWLWARLERELGSEAARQYALASLDRPVTWVRARDADFRPDWAEPGPLAGSLKVVAGGPIQEKSGFDSGAFIVQDISSQRLVTEIAAHVRAACPDSLRALDLCAAPGGKSVGLAWSGFEVLAADREPARYQLLQSTVARAVPDGRVRIIEREQVSGLEPLDLVWVDAPCTGTGILRRHPDVRWLRREAELEGLAGVQRELLAQAWALVRPGGFLAYSVCSVLAEEGPGRIESFAGATPGALPSRSWFFLPQQEPHGDGFWAALVQKGPGNSSHW